LLDGDPHERLDDLGVKLGSGGSGDVIAGRPHGVCTIGVPSGQHLQRRRHGNDARFPRDRVAGKPVQRVAGIPVFLSVDGDEAADPSPNVGGVESPHTIDAVNAAGK
jgi:hypothetical protein